MDTPVNRWTSFLSVLLMAGCGASASPVPGFESVGASPPTETSALMLRHYDHARSLSSAAIFGRPALAMAAAAAIRQEGPMSGMSAEAGPAYRAFVASVAAVEQADDRSELALSAAVVARQCGECHLASGLGPSFELGRPVEAVTPRDHLRVLAWASSRMWESLIGGSDLAWRAGARALSGQRLDEDLYASRASDLDAARGLAARLHDLGVRALSSSERGERAALLGEVWGTCSGCHDLVGLSG